MITKARLDELLTYCPETGVFTWKVFRGGKAKPGSTAGSFDTYGYRQINVDQHLHLAHRLAWLAVHGELPESHIDHIDRDRSNNAIANLRGCTHSENHQNRNISSNNTSGVEGVSFHKRSGKWHAHIRHDGKRYWLGEYRDIKEASLARLEAKKRLHTFHPIQEGVA